MNLDEIFRLSENRNEIDKKKFRNLPLLQLMMEIFRLLKLLSSATEKNCTIKIK